MTLEITRLPSSTTAAAVSSQEDSIASIFISLTLICQKNFVIISASSRGSE